MTFDDRLHNVESAARKLGVSKSFLNKARQDGSGPAFYKLGRSVRYAEGALDRYLEETKQYRTKRDEGRRAS